MNLKELREEDTRKRYTISVKNKYADENNMDELERE